MNLGGFSHRKISVGIPDNFAADFVPRGWFPMDPVLEGKSQGKFIFPGGIFCKRNTDCFLIYPPDLHALFVRNSYPHVSLIMILNLFFLNNEKNWI